MSKKGREGWESLGLEVLRSADFEGPHLRRDGTYAVCFGATWCRPTRGFAPKFAAREGRLPIKLAMADITEMDDPLWDSFQIKITPTIVVFRDGVTVARFDGRRMLGLRDSDLDRLADVVGRLTRGDPGPPGRPPAT